MSAFTNRLYRSWSFQNGYSGPRARGQRGYGVQPHGSEAKRHEGYPIDQTVPPGTLKATHPARPMPTMNILSRIGLQCASDATSRPEKPAVLNPGHAFF